MQANPDTRAALAFDCLHCGGTIPERRRPYKAKYCSRRCRLDYAVKEYAALNSYPDKEKDRIASGSVGAAAEMVVCADLLLRGYAVFRAVSPACSCDLAILRNGRLLRVEVKTGHRNGSGYQVPRAEKDRFDVLAIVLRHNREIIYDPPEFGDEPETREPALL